MHRAPPMNWLMYPPYQYQPYYYQPYYYQPYFYNPYRRFSYGVIINGGGGVYVSYGF
jgi:hypothetical protein